MEKRLEQHSKLRRVKKSLVLSVTKRCNLHCLYCKPEKNKTHDRLSFFSTLMDYPKEEFDKILKICHKENIEETLLIGGEPLEYPHILDLLHYLYDKKIKFSFHTNGVSSHWTKVLAFIKDKKQTPNVVLSIEMTEKMQNELRHSPIPFKLIDSLNELGCKIELKITLHKEILKYTTDLKDFLNFWLNKNVSSIRFQPVIPVGSEKKFNKIILDDSCIPIFQELIRFKKDERYKNIIRNSELNLNISMSMLKKEKISQKIISLCDAKKRITFMRTNGDIIDCFGLCGKTDCVNDFDYQCCAFYP